MHLPTLDVPVFSALEFSLDCNQMTWQMMHLPILDVRALHIH